MLDSLAGQIMPMRPAILSIPLTTDAVERGVRSDATHAHTPG